jgi:GNAT superfamily N-acetyltransferase
MIRPVVEADYPVILEVIEDAAAAYRGVIPADCWQEPYLSAAELRDEVTAGIEFFGWEERGEILGVMGLQHVRDVTLIRHAYTRPADQGRGIGSQLLAHLRERAPGRLLVGTWAAAGWAVRFYEQRGFTRVEPEETERLLTTYWTVPERQRQASVVLAATGRPEASAFASETVGKETSQWPRHGWSS